MRQGAKDAATPRREQQMDTAARGDREAENSSAEAAAEQPTAPTLAEQLSSHLLGLCDELRDEARDQGETALRRRTQQVTDTMFEVFQELDAINHELAKSSSESDE